MQNLFYTRYTSIVQILSNQQSAKWFVGLIELEQHTARKNKSYELRNLLATYVFDYIRSAQG